MNTEYNILQFLGKKKNQIHPANDRHTINRKAPVITYTPEWNRLFRRYRTTDRLYFHLVFKHLIRQQKSMDHIPKKSTEAGRYWNAVEEVDSRPWPCPNLSLRLLLIWSVRVMFLSNMNYYDYYRLNEVWINAVVLKISRSRGPQKIDSDCFDSIIRELFNHGTTFSGN